MVHLQIKTTRSKSVYLWQEIMVFSKEDKIIIQSDNEVGSQNLEEPSIQKMELFLC